MTSTSRESSQLSATPLEVLVQAAESGSVASLARLLSIVENDPRAAEALDSALPDRRDDCHVIGITGPPGVGKSTTTNALVREARRRDRRVAVLAVDPSSPLTGGALLGDRVRMQEHGSDEDVYVRSMASRGHLGGLSTAVPQAVRVLAAARYDLVIVETVGVGQSEVEIANVSDTAMVILAPGMGDNIQAAKAGLLEVADLFVVNKADRDGADDVRRDLRAMIALVRHPAGAWRAPVVMTVATDSTGLEDVLSAVERHQEHLMTGTLLAQRRLRAHRAEIQALVMARMAQALESVSSALDELAESVGSAAMARDVAAERATRLVADASKGARR